MRAAVFAAMAALVLASQALASQADAEEAAKSPRIPFVPGLTTVRAISEPRGDYETLGVIDAITSDGYRTTASGEVPADDGKNMIELAIVRKVRAVDQRASRRMRSYSHTGDAHQFTGTVPGFSTVMMTDLRQTGTTQLIYLDVGAIFGMSIVLRELSGTISRVEGGTTSLPMLVNGRRVPLPVIHAKGLLSDGSDSEAFEFHVLDDPGNPIMLRSRRLGISSALIRIEYPEPDNAARSIERELAANRSADIYGIYFSFASAAIRPQSERVLKEIADVLKTHPDWALRIDGHTDGIGSEASNLDLSRRRAAAVKTALVERHGIAAGRLATGGFGESRPKETNDTPEGRARNRRVELRRE